MSLKPTNKVSLTAPKDRRRDLDAVAAAEADAGIGIPIEEIEVWVESWDTPAELPMPTPRKVP